MCGGLALVVPVYTGVINLDMNYQLVRISELRHLEIELATRLVDGRIIIGVFLTLQNQGSRYLARA